MTREEFKKELTDHESKWWKAEYKRMYEATVDMANILIVLGKLTKEEYEEAIIKLVDYKMDQTVANTKDEDLSTSEFMMNLFGCLL